MSTPTSSAGTPRGTPSLNVPATQNTAPVIKFRCLYTHDTRRKAKRWQDGFLRFHTFNKRVMAYDTTGNFIGDLHWRQDEGIQDGDELELDRGVLIQVCEPMEKTETDLSTLLPKKKSQASPSRPDNSPTPTPSLRATAQMRSFSSQQPRSLNDLLGIKKAPVGRVVSPYEERHSIRQDVNQNSSERAAKRQRTDLPERALEQIPSRADRPQPVVIGLESSATTEEITAPTAAPGQDKRPKENTQPSKSASSATPTVPPRQNSDTRIVESSRSASKDTPVPKPPSMPRVAPIEKTDNRNIESSRIIPKVPPPKPPSISKVASREQAENMNVESSRKDSAVPKPPSKIHPDVPLNPLRLSTERPRKKLMYSALLPGQTSVKRSNSAPLSEKANPSGEKSQEVNTPDDTSTNPDFTPGSSTQFVLNEMAEQSSSKRGLSTAIGQNPRMQGPLMTKSSGLRKSYSDPTALTFNNGIQPQPTSFNSPLPDIEEDKPYEQGPWTAEALDLFDFWPPGRPKPE